MSGELLAKEYGHNVTTKEGGANISCLNIKFSVPTTTTTTTIRAKDYFLHFIEI